MKKMILVFIAITCLAIFSNAQTETEKKEPLKKYMQITTIESVIGGGFGRSKMVITNGDGSQEERDMENLFSMTGMNMKNIKSNESDILKTLKTYTDDGWKLELTIPLTLSPSDRNPGIFMTRYLLWKADEKKAF